MLFGMLIRTLMCGSLLEKDNAYKIMATESHEVIKGARDRCDYLCLDLKNGVKIALIHDPRAWREIVVVNVNAGADREEYPGLAHLAVHLLFKGTKKYPGERNNDYFLKFYKGVAMADVTLNHSMYSFSVPASWGSVCLDEAIDRLSQFFISPLFPKKCVQRDIDAIDAEFEESRNLDCKRRERVLKSYTNPEHPLSRFIAGNKETLQEESVDMRSEVIRFYKKHYLPQNMVVVVHTPRELRDVKRVVADAFGTIGRGIWTEDEPRKNNIAPYLPDMFSEIFWIKSIEGYRRMAITYVLPEGCADVDMMQHTYLAEMLSSRGTNTLFGLLLCNDLATDVNPSFYYDHNYKYGVFSVAVDLTERGLEKYRTVIKIILALIDIVKCEPIDVEVLQKNYLDRKKCFDKSSYNNDSTFDVMDLVARNIRDYGFARMLPGSHLGENCDPQALKKFHEMLGSSFFVTVLDPEFRDDFDRHGQKQEVLKEMYYGTCYRKQRYEEESALNAEALWYVLKLMQ